MPGKMIQVRWTLEIAGREFGVVRTTGGGSSDGWFAFRRGNHEVEVEHQRAQKRVDEKAGLTRAIRDRSRLVAEAVAQLAVRLDDA